MPIALLTLVALTSACVRFTWNRELRHEPVPVVAIGALEQGRSTLEQCLTTFGAPLWVWERVEAGRVRIVLAYGWFGGRDMGLRVSVPVSRGISPYFDYDQIDERMRGLLLFFDEDCTLTNFEVGPLRDLTLDLRRPPLFLEGLEQDPDEDPVPAEDP
jgi:hypothetical protein